MPLNWFLSLMIAFTAFTACGHIYGIQLPIPFVLALWTCAIASVSNPLVTLIPNRATRANIFTELVHVGNC